MTNVSRENKLVRYIDKITLDFVMKSQWFSLNKLRELQLEGLQDLCNHAREHTKYYKNLPLIKEIEDLKQVSILTKKIIHDKFKALNADNIPSVQKWTGGTSEQVTLNTNYDQTPMIAMNDRFYYWHPKNTLERAIVIWGGGELRHKQPYEVVWFNKLCGKETPMKFYIIEWLVNEEKILECLKDIQIFNPTSIRTYASTLRSLAFYAVKHNIRLPDLKLVINNCEPLSKDIRNLVYEAWNVPVWDFYGSQDLGSMAYECEKHEGLHISMERYIVEVTEDGRLLWTDLFNWAMPLIRYENGDIGKFSERVCSCGRGLPLFEGVIGRTLQYLWTKQDNWLNSTEINESLYYDVPDYLKLIEAHQVQQNERGKIILWVKPWDKNILPDFSIIRKAFIDRLDIDIQITDEIKRSQSGKQLTVITKFRPPWLGKEQWTEQGVEVRGDKPNV